MPSYKVLKQGFFDGKIYDPNGKRTVLHTDKEFPKEKGKELVPSWLSRVEEKEVPKSQTKRARKAKVEEDVAKKRADEKEIKGASFMAGDTDSAVEIL